MVRRQAAKRCENSLSEAEDALLRALRHWLAGEVKDDPGHRDRAHLELATLAGPGAAEIVLGHLDVLVRIVARGATRALRYHPPCCRHVGTDEALLLALIAAGQAADEPLTEALVELVVDPLHAAAVSAAARDLGHAIAAAGLILSPTRPALASGGLARAGGLMVH